MSDFLNRISKLSPQRLALLADELNERVQASERSRKVPLAVVGIGCRFPGGVRNSDDFWKLLSEGMDAVSEVPASRWDIDEFYDRDPDTPGKMATRWGGFIDEPDRFDPHFFGIAPSEAASMDPQQRLLLETAWEALEHAGIAPSSLAGTPAGVFVGICNSDYNQVALKSPREKITPYFASGLSHAVAAGRISYVLGLQGPSMAVDTSCSASLVAVHLACQSLRLGECNAALAGGVNLILNPEVTIALSQSRMMAPDGRCKAFSDFANGFVRGEGCGIIVLKRLPDALRDGNRVLAVIRGSACNQDGRSSGLTAPNGPSQEAVISAALSDAGLRPVDVDYIEAHGTGTPLGDPIEIGALNAVFARTSADSGPLFVGSVKTNLGHLEPAAGIAGLIKLLLSIQHGKIPASLHFQRPNSRIDWDRLPIQVPTGLQTWNRRGQKRVGGVSSFGFSGTNAHVVVEEYVEENRSDQQPIVDQPRLFPLSAKTESALKMMATRLEQHLREHPSLRLADIAHTLIAGRSRFEYRAVMVAGSQVELLEALRGVASNSAHPDVQIGRAKLHAFRQAAESHPTESSPSGDARQFLRAAGARFVLGGELDIGALDPDAFAAATVSLPTYPFERERYWLDPENGGQRLQHPAKKAGFDQKTAPAAADQKWRDEWIYDLVWEAKPLPQQLGAGFDANLFESMSVRTADTELIHYNALSAQLDPVCTAYILGALKKLGADSLPDRTFTLQELWQRFNIAAPRRRLFARLLDILIEDDLAERSDEGYRLHGSIAFLQNTSQSELQRLQAAYPLCRTEMNVLARCGENLASVLRGETDPLHLLFPNNSTEETEHIYRNSPIARYYNESIGELVRTAVVQSPGRTVRILEVGAGTGATTGAILAKLTGNEFNYTFTDISPAFLARARVKFSDFPALDYRVLDIEKDPVEQKFEPGNYDIVIAANVLHATADLRRTLAHLQELLAPRGLALLLEGMRPDRGADLTFGLTDGWWRFADHDLRPDYPLIAANTWTRLLKESGAASARVMSYATDSASAPPQQMLIVAQTAADDHAERIGKHTLLRRYVIFADQAGIGDELNTLVTHAGSRCELIHRSDSSGEVGEVVARLSEALARSGDSPVEIVYLWATDVSDSADTPAMLSKAEDLCVRTPVHIVQTMLRHSGGPAHLWLVTRGAQATTSFSPDAEGAAQSMMWGVGRVIGLENPERYRGLIDLAPTEAFHDSAASIFAELLADDKEDQIAYREGQRLVVRLKNSPLERSAQNPNGSRLRKDAAYLITGGLGGIGLRLSRWAAEQGAGHLVLLGRTGTGANAGPFATERLQAIQEIRGLGANVTVVEGDVTSEQDMAHLFRRFDGELPALRGIVHAATAFSNVALSDITDEQIKVMLQPKVRGAWLLHQLTRNVDLDFFLAFSSAASVLGGKGMAHYAAANIFLDSFAHYRRAQGLPMLSIDWGAWDVMRRFTRQDQDRFSQGGLLPMESEKLFELIGELIHSPRAQVMVADVDWDVMKPMLEVNRVRPMLENMGSRSKRGISGAAVPAISTLDMAAAMMPESRRKFIERFVQDQAARVLGFRRGELPPADVPLTDLGLDSLMAVDLKNSLQNGLCRELSPTIVFDFPTVSGIVGLLETILWAAHSPAEDDLAAVQKDEICI